MLLEGTPSISAIGLDGRNRTTLVSGEMVSPRDLAVDPLSDWMFWTDYGRAKVNYNSYGYRNSRYTSTTPTRTDGRYIHTLCIRINYI